MARILVIDDSAVQRIFAKAALEAEEHEVVEAAGGEAGLAQVEAEAFDCILLDWVMPETSGADVLRAMSQIPSTRDKVIVVTGSPDDSIHAECQSLGAAAIIDKPRDLETLRDAVNNVVARA